MQFTHNVSNFWELFYSYQRPIALQIKPFLCWFNILCNISWFWSLWCGPQSLFQFNLRPAGTYFFSMRPVYSFEFETPALDRSITRDNGMGDRHEWTSLDYMDLIQKKRSIEMELGTCGPQKLEVFVLLCIYFTKKYWFIFRFNDL